MEYYTFAEYGDMMLLYGEASRRGAEKKACVVILRVVEKRYVSGHEFLC